MRGHKFVRIPSWTSTHDGLRAKEQRTCEECDRPIYDGDYVRVVFRGYGKRGTREYTYLSVSFGHYSCLI